MTAEKVILQTRPAGTGQPFGDAENYTHPDEEPIAFGSERPDGGLDMFVAGWIHGGLLGPYLWKILSGTRHDNVILDAALMVVANLRDGSHTFEVVREGKPVEVALSYEAETSSAPEVDYRCPGCNTTSDFVVGPNQALCRNINCRILNFDPTLYDGGLSKGAVKVMPNLLEPQL